MASFTFREKTRRLSVEVDLVVEMVTINPFDFFVEEYAEHWPFEYEAHLKKDLSPIWRSSRAKRLRTWVKKRCHVTSGGSSICWWS